MLSWLAPLLNAKKERKRRKQESVDTQVRVFSERKNNSLNYLLILKDMTRVLPEILVFCFLSSSLALDFAVIGDYGYIYNLTNAETTFAAMEREAA